MRPAAFLAAARVPVRRPVWPSRLASACTASCRSVAIDQFAAQRRFLVDRGAPESPQRRLHRVDRLAGFGGHGPFGDDPQSAGQFHAAVCEPPCTVCTALSRLAISVSSRAATSALDSSALGRRCCARRRRRTADRAREPVPTAVPRAPDRWSGRTGCSPAPRRPVRRIRRSARCRSRFRRSSLDAGGGTSCQPRVYSSRVASPPSPRSNASRGARLTVNSRIPPSWRPSRSTKSRSKTWVSLSRRAGVPPRAAVEPPRHLLPQHHLPVPQRQEQIVHALFGREKCRERREGDSGAQVHQHRMHRLGAEVFGEFFADDDVADRLTLAEPQRLQGTGPGRPPCQLHVGEGLEQLLRTHAVQPLDCRVDGIRRARVPARRRRR